MENLRSAKMATTPVKKLLISMSLPAIFSMLVQAVYNVVDSLYLARFSPKAIEAMGIIFPMQMLIIAIGIGIGVGTNVYISKSLGEGRRDRANRAAQSSAPARATNSTPATRSPRIAKRPDNHPFRFLNILTHLFR